MGLYVLLPTGPKRAGVIHLAFSTRRRTSIKEHEKETLLAGRQEDVAKKLQAFLLQ